MSPVKGKSSYIDGLTAPRTVSIVFERILVKSWYLCSFRSKSMKTLWSALSFKCWRCFKCAVISVPAGLDVAKTLQCPVNIHVCEMVNGRMNWTVLKVQSGLLKTVRSGNTHTHTRHWHAHINRQGTSKHAPISTLCSPIHFNQISA